MDPISLGTFLKVVGSIFGLTSSLGTQNKNIDTQLEINKQNLDYAAAMTQQQWERDDVAYQRQVADAVAAGVSPLAVLGSSYGNSSALPFQAQAPQLDASSIANTVQDAMNMFQENEHFDKKLRQQQNEFFETSAEEWARIAHEYDYKNSSLIQQQVQFSKTLELENKKYEQAVLEFKTKQEFDAWKALVEQATDELPDACTPVYYDDFEKYKKAKDSWTKEYIKFCEDIGATSTSKGSSGNGSAGVGVGPVKVNGSGAGSTSSSENNSQRIDARLDAWYRAHPYPIYMGTYAQFKASTY